MTVKYLEQFEDVIRKRQVTQVLDLLNKQKEDGEIRTVEEFISRLDTLIRALNESTLVPTLKLFAANKDGIISSETFNFMLDRIKDDLSAGFEEANHISEVQKSHEAIVRDIILKTIKNGIAELETKIEIYQLLKTLPEGFDTAVFSTFRELQENRSTRVIEDSGVLFTDPRTGESLGIEYDAYLDPIGERIILPTQGDPLYITIKSAKQLFQSDAPKGYIDITPTELKNTKRTIDGEKYTYWMFVSLFAERQDYVSAKVEFSLDGNRAIDFIEIEPAINQSLILDSVEYIGPDNALVDLGIDSQILTSSAIIHFNTITAKKIILTIKTEDYYLVQFEGNSTENSIHTSENNLESLISLVGTSTDKEFQDNVQTLVRSSLSLILNNSTSLKDLLGIQQVEAQETYSGYAYTIGLDNVRIGSSVYQNTGIYVSAPLVEEEIGVLTLKSEEKRPVYSLTTKEISYSSDTYDVSSSLRCEGSIEYWVVRRDRKADDSIFQTSIYPILPHEVDRVYYERLFLTEKYTGFSDNNIGRTMFFTQSSGGDIEVYRDGKLLSHPTDWDAFFTSSDSSDDLPCSGVPMRTNIFIRDPFPGSIYTVSYNPLASEGIAFPRLVDHFSSADYKIVDLKGDMTVRRCKVGDSTQIIYMNKDINAKQIARSEYFLMIILRNNSANQSITPIVEEYILAGGTRDPSKFTELLYEISSEDVQYMSARYE